MIFNSLEYILFFILVFAISLFLGKGKWILLLIASFYFYCCWRVDYLPLLLATILINYVCARAIAGVQGESARKAFLSLSLIVSLGLLFTFKYFNFVGGLINEVYIYFGIPRIAPVLNVALPIGISFFTFQAVGYTIDVFSGKVKPERHLGIFSLFVSFFPQLVAGPIERADNLLPQFRKRPPFDYERVASGFILALWGLFKKIVIADRLAFYVDAVYNDVNGYTGLPLVLSTYFFTFQIYCDFSGYSDIAIGCARMMGYDLRMNFDRPYFSASLPEFWRRWHISLMSWFRDYVYFPLGGSRKGQTRKQCNQFAVFFLSGLWHGANLTFVFWGVYHAVLQILSNLGLPFVRRFSDSIGMDPKLKKGIGIVITFHLVCFGWIIFRANSIRDLAYIVRNVFHDVTNLSAVLVPLDSKELLLAFLAIGLLLLIELAQGSKRCVDMFERRPVLVRYPLYCMLVAGLLLFGVFKEEPFLYFQF
jgi:D-alanyl-lipoteichoic acid acyltransferase DltB (MBOAT superfamily)